MRRGPGPAQRDERDDGDGGELERDEPRPEVAGGGDGDAARRRRQEQGGGDRGVAPAGPAVVQQGEGGRRGEEHGGLERRGARAGRPEAGAVGRREAEGAQRLELGAEAATQRDERPGDEHDPGQRQRPPRAPGSHGVADEDEDDPEHGRQRRGEDEGVDGDEGRHRAPPSAATASWVTDSRSIGATPSRTTSADRPPSSQRSTPTVSGVAGDSGSGRSPDHTRPATRKA